MLCAQFPLHVKEIKSYANQTVNIKGNLNLGAKMENLNWAWNINIACFPAKQKQKFTGNHVLYHTVLPSKAMMSITVVPNDKTANFSLYAYQIGTTNYSTVPDLSSCVTCEADYKWDYAKVNKTQDHRRMVEVNSTNNSYNIVIGVVGADGLSEGGYTISIQLVGGE
jgi:hypothetical protein